MKATSNGTETKFDKEIQAGFYYFGPTYDRTDLPGEQVQVQHSDTKTVEQLIPVESFKWDTPGITHAVVVVSCEHLAEKLSCSECKGDTAHYVGHWE